MADPLSIAASAASLLTLGVQTVNSLIKFYTAYKDQHANVARTLQRLQGLSSTINLLEVALRDRKFDHEERGLLQRVDSSVKECEELIDELQSECEKCSSSDKTLTKVGRRLAYPFRESTLKKLDEDIEAFYECVSLALDVLHLRDNKSIQDDIADLKTDIELIRATQISTTLRDWLKAPDPSINHNAACAKRHPQTGMWLIESSTFKDWLNESNSILWLYGFAGCGKTILCSTSIQHVFRYRRSDKSIGIAIFYFTFNDEAKRDEAAMMRSLLLQLAGQHADGDSILLRLRESYQTKEIPKPMLMETLRQTIQKFGQVYIFLDALDETTRYKQREDILGLIEIMRNWSLSGLHLLITSRDEVDIRGSLDLSENQKIMMRNSKIDQDIITYIHTQLTTERKLRQWESHHQLIQNKLAARAHGV